jgi:enolase
MILKGFFGDKGYSTAVGDEGGFAPDLNPTMKAWDSFCRR